MGRTNKLVDGCYSFWQGALFPLLQRLSPQLLAQTGVPIQPASAVTETSVASPSRVGVGNNAAGISRSGGRDAASQFHPQRSSSVTSGSGGVDPESAQGPAARRITVPPLPDILACSPAAAARAQAAALKATADAAVQAAIAAQLSAASAGGAADDSAAPGLAPGWQRRELASERVRQLADTAGAALEVRLHVSEQPQTVWMYNTAISSMMRNRDPAGFAAVCGAIMRPVMVAPQNQSAIAYSLPGLSNTRTRCGARILTLCLNVDGTARLMLTCLPVQAASAAAAHADAMQASAAELLAGPRRAAQRRDPESVDADTDATGVPSASATTAEAASAAPSSGTRPETDGCQSAEVSELPKPPSSDTRHAPEPLTHRLPGEYAAPLYDPDALQLWLLQCCQTVRLHMHVEHARHFQSVITMYQSSDRNRLRNTAQDVSDGVASATSPGSRWTTTTRATA